MGDKPKWGEWYSDNGIYVIWMRASPNGTNASCNRCGTLVPRGNARVWIDNNQGTTTERSHGKANEKVCLHCALSDGLVAPAPDPSWW